MKAQKHPEQFAGFSEANDLLASPFPPGILMVRGIFYFYLYFICSAFSVGITLCLYVSFFLFIIGYFLSYLIVSNPESKLQL